MIGFNSGYLILKQAEFYLDKKKRFNLAKKFVEGAVINMLKVLRYYNTRGCNLESSILGIENLQEKISIQRGIEELMAIEGNIREKYYEAFNDIIKNENYYFLKRTKRPPRTKLDALISFGNSMFYTVALCEIYKTHLDPRVGFLHSTNFRRFTLNLDVSEVFKPIIVDRVLFSLLNKQMLKENHFMEELNKVYLNDKGKELFIREFEDKLKSTIKHSKLKKNVSYRRLVRMELYKIEKHLIGEEHYEPFVARW